LRHKGGVLQGREIALEAFGTVFAFFYSEGDWEPENTALFPRGFIELEDAVEEAPVDVIVAELTEQTEDKLDKLRQEQSALWEFSTNGEVSRLIDVARARLKECFGESCEVYNQSVSQRYYGGPRFYVMLFASASYEAHLEHCDDSSFVTLDALSTTWDMENQDLVCVQILSELPKEALSALVDLGKLKTIVQQASTYHTISCSF